LGSVLRQSGGAMSGNGSSRRWLAAYGLSRGVWQRHLQHVTTGVADDRDRSSRRPVSYRSGPFVLRLLQGDGRCIGWRWRPQRSRSLTKAGFSPLRARISGARSVALFDPLRAKWNFII